MFLDLYLENIDPNNLKSFLDYVIKQIQIETINGYDKRKAARLEEFINKNNVIEYTSTKKYTSVIELYKIALFNLVVEDMRKDIYRIHVNYNINIPYSKTNLSSVIKLLEFGNLSVNKYGLLTNIMENIGKNLDFYYSKFSMEIE